RGLASSAAAGHCPSLPHGTRPARSTSLRCLLTEARLMSKGLAISVADAPPFARRARISRRVGSARAPNVRLRRSTARSLLELFNHLVYYTMQAAASRS